MGFYVELYIFFGADTCRQIASTQFVISPISAVPLPVEMALMVPRIVMAVAQDHTGSIRQEYLHALSSSVLKSCDINNY